jgi:hypothetical protein
MRRYTFYIFTALLTFGISFSFVLIYYFQSKVPENRIKTTDKLVNYEDKTNENFTSPADSGKESSFGCKDEIRKYLWSELKTDKKYGKWKNIFEDESNCSEKMFKVEAVDLNNDGKDEFLVRGDDAGFCGATANCDFWIYRKIGEKYHRVLSGYSYLDGRDISSQIKKSKNNKFKDILLEVRVERNAHAYRLYKFDGKKYKEKRCRIDQWNELEPEAKSKIVSCRTFERNNYKLDF